MCNPKFAWLGILALAAGCGQSTGPAPELLNVCRTDSLGACQNWAWTGERAELALLGDGFHSTAIVDLGSRDAPLTGSVFRAWVGGSALQDVGLADGGESTRKLLGRLRGDLAAGIYPAELITPTGQHADRDDALRVIDPLEGGLVLQTPWMPVGGLARIDVWLSNLGTGELREVRLALHQTGDGTIALASLPEVFNLGGGQQRVIPLELAVQSAGTIDLTTEVSARTESGLTIEASMPVARLLAAAGAELEVQARVEPPAVVVGGRFELVLSVRNRGDTAALALVIPTVSGDGSGSVSWDAPPSAVDLPAGGATALRWGATAAGAGSLDFSPTVQATEDGSSQLLQAAVSAPVHLDIF